MRNSGSVIGAEQTAVIAALNIANEMFAYKQENKDYTSEVGLVVERLHQKVNEALTQGSQVETARDCIPRLFDLGGMSGAKSCGEEGRGKVWFGYLLSCSCSDRQKLELVFCQPGS